jgi:glutamyl-tRNA(Gln) amidotransferase subunit D
MNKILKIKFQNSIIEGFLIQNREDELILKIKSGYNIVLDKNRIEILEERNIEDKKDFNVNLNQNKSLPKITLIHTGGTIASKVDYETGAVSSKFKPEELLSLFPELLDKVEIDIVMAGNLFSEDMRFSHYNLFLDKIKNITKTDSIGVIISHGTDTLHYTSAALNYSLENLSFPIILVGAQRSSDRPSSDAFSNLNAAVDFILENNKQSKQFNRVGICMHETISDNSFLILDGFNAKKTHSTKRDTFKQINNKPFARLEYNLNNFNLEKFEILRKELLTERNNKNELKIKKYDENLKIGILKVHPNLFSEEVEFYSNCDALILEGTGLGHLPINEIDDSTKEHSKIYNSIKELAKKIPVIISTQTGEGGVFLNVYSTGRKLDKIGVVGNFSKLITENAFIKTAYILSNYKKEDFKKIWQELNIKESL